MDRATVWSRSEVAHIHDGHQDSRRPIFHPLAPRGWSSDPCGPILYKGRYHLFYQHQHASCQWFWGLCWDHVVSEDLVHWKNLPPAVVPTPGLDADGCFSGTVEFDPELGVPVILYTGVYLKTNADAVAAHGLPPPEHDPGTRFVERQLAAVPADPDDPDLTYWVKLPTPVMSLPPAGLNISCWRDPFCLHRPAAAGGDGDEWVVLLASGIRGVGGAVLRFKSKHFTHGWEFDGLLADGDNNALGIRGQDWECPILTQLPQATRTDLAAAATTAASPSAAIAATLSAKLSLTQTPPSAPSSSSSNGTVVSHAEPGTPELRSPAVKPLVSSISGASRSTLSSFGSSSLNLAAAAAAVDDAVSVSGSSSAAMLSPIRTQTDTVGAGPTIAATATGVVSAAAEGSLLALPLTEPTLAAATSAAEAAASSIADSTLMSHPAVSVDVWVEHQTEAAAVAAVAAAGSVAAQGAMVTPDDIIYVEDDITVVITAEDDTSSVSLSDSKSKHRQRQQQQEPVLLTDALSLSTSGSNSSSSDPTTSSSSNGGSNGGGWWFCMSPDACNNPITWWLGDYDGRRFDIAAADGPHRLDLGTTLYAATLWQDPQGRQLLYGWIQEHRRVPTPPALCDDYSYAGCISTPRLLHLVEGRLWQTPLPELNRLRTRVSWHATDLQLSPCDPLLPLQVVSSTHLDINLTLLPPAAATAATAATTAAAAAEQDSEGCCAGLVFKSWRSGGLGAAVLSFNWDSCVLMFDFDEPFPDAYDPHPVDTPERRRVGGRLRNYVAGDALSLRILLDGSAVEVFTSTGETLTTRMYRGHPPKCTCTACSPAAAAVADAAALEPTSSSIPTAAAVAAGAAVVEDETGIALFAAGAAVTVREVDVWEMGSCWVAPSAAPPQPPALLQQQQMAAAAAHHVGGAAVGGVAAGGGEAGIEVAVHGVPAAAAAAASGLPADEVAAMAAVGEPPEQHHQYNHPSSCQAVVTEEFLEGLHIHSN